MIRISQLKLPIQHTAAQLEEKMCQQLKIQKTDFHIKIISYLQKNL